jgi:hypothetical protein
VELGSPLIITAMGNEATNRDFDIHFQEPPKKLARHDDDIEFSQ